METIYLPLASLDDYELVHTVKRAFDLAKHPERIRVGLSLFSSTKIKDLFLEGTKEYSDRISFEYTELKESNFHDMIGVGKARERALKFYNNEDYMLQIDPHSLFTKGWDDLMIKTLKKAKKATGNDRVILTGYAGHYSYDAFGKPIFLDPKRNVFGIEGKLGYPVFETSERYYGLIPSWTIFNQTKDKPLSGEFVPALKFNANFSFGDSEFAKNPGLHKECLFFEEEITQTINLIKLGYTLVFPNWDKPVLGHLYTDFISRRFGWRNSAHDYQYFDVDSWHNQAKLIYKSFLDDPENKDAIEKFKKYARVHMLYGPLDNSYYVPNHFINSEVKYVR